MEENTIMLRDGGVIYITRVVSPEMQSEKVAVELVIEDTMTVSSFQRNTSVKVCVPY